MDKKKLKIAIFTDNFFPAVGGTENAVYNLATALTELGHEILVVAPNYKNADDSKYIFRVFRKSSIKIDANNNYALPFFNKKLYKVLDEFNADILHCHSQASMLSLAIKYGKKHKLPVVSTIHTKFSYCYKDSAKLNIIVKPMLKSIGRKLKQVDRVTAVSYSMADEFKLYGYNGQFDVIKNGLSINSFKPIEIENIAREKYKLKSTDNIFIFVGRITKVKNISFILDTLQKLKEKGLKFKMFIVGEGGDLPYFKSMAKEKNIEDMVEFTGKITDKHLLASLYYNSNLNIFPSIFDNDSLTIVEAAMYGTPSITLMNTGSSERITDGQNGYIVQNNADKMAEQIAEILKDKRQLKIVGENAKNELVKSWKDVTQEYLAIYYEILNQKKTI